MYHTKLEVEGIEKSKGYSFYEKQRLHDKENNIETKTIYIHAKSCFLHLTLSIKYRISPIIRPTHKIRPSVIFEDDCNVSPTLKISPS